MRGEDFETASNNASLGGSPPHARGRPAGRTSTSPRGGITPACAGKTSTAKSSATNSADHPRMRGEDIQWHFSLLLQAGSPPHARGRLTTVAHKNVIVRITPACAGKTASDSSIENCTLDHPRMRGEDRPQILRAELGEGSPPHARGRLTHHFSEKAMERITPACAGKTSSAGTARTGVTDHPRMRGEDLHLVQPLGGAPGSPPHARGRHE